MCPLTSRYRIRIDGLNHGADSITYTTSFSWDSTQSGSFKIVSWNGYIGLNYGCAVTENFREFRSVNKNYCCIPFTKEVGWSFDIFFIVNLTICWKNSRVAVDLRHHDAQVTSLFCLVIGCIIGCRTVEMACCTNPTMHQSHIPHCTIWNRNVHMCAHFCYKMVQHGILYLMHLGSVRCVNWPW